MVDKGTAVKTRFPTRAKAIDALLTRDEGFRDMCADYAAAEEELRQWRSSPDAHRDARIVEYSELVEELAAEIDATLDRAAVVPFPKR